MVSSPQVSGVETRALPNARALALASVLACIALLIHRTAPNAVLVPLEAPAELADGQSVSEPPAEVEVPRRREIATPSGRALQVGTHAVMQVAPQPLHSSVGHWASHDHRVERNARARAEIIAQNEALLADPNIEREKRTIYLRCMTIAAVYVIEDYEGNSMYADVRRPKPVPGFRTSSNGGALYHIPHGKYPVFDLLDPRNERRHEVLRSDIEDLVKRAKALLEPYAER